MKDQLDLLIEIISDPSTREDEIGDAIMYLGNFNDSKALEALLKFGIKKDIPDDIQDDCGNSIGRLCVALHKFDDRIINNLNKITQKSAIIYIFTHDKKLLPKELRENMKID